MTCQHYVLPHHDSFFVAQIVKLVVFVHSAAPYPHKICVQFRNIFNDFRRFFSVFAVIHVDRRVICAAHPHGFSVYHKMKISVRSYFFAEQYVDLSHAVTKTFFRYNFPAAYDCDSAIVQIRRAAACRIPKFRLPDIRIHGERIESERIFRRNFRIFAFRRKFKRTLPEICFVYCRIHRQYKYGNVFFRPTGGNIIVRNFVFGNTFQINVFPDSRRYGARQNIPTVRSGALSHVQAFVTARKSHVVW